MDHPTRPPQPELSTANAAIQSYTLSLNEFEAFLAALLTRFHESSPREQQDVAYFAKAATAAFVLELQRTARRNAPHEDVPAAGIATIETQLEHQLAILATDTAPGKEGDSGRPKRSRQFGATEGQWTRTISPSTWGEAIIALGFNPSDEITPG